MSRASTPTRAGLATTPSARPSPELSTMADADAILFDSRLTSGACVAIYDRAFSALSGTIPIGLLQAAMLPAEITRLGITLRRHRGYAP